MGVMLWGSLMTEDEEYEFVGLVKRVERLEEKVEGLQKVVMKALEETREAVNDLHEMARGLTGRVQ